jgi:nitrite reductase (NADH) large subunit
MGYNRNVRHVIIGNGVAGTSAASSIRKIDGSCDIVILSEEATPFYSRIRLIDYLAGQTDEQGLIIYRDEWYEKNRIRLLLNSTVTDIDTRARAVQCADGTTIEYDRLLIAAGSLPIIPPVARSRMRGVFTLRSVEDARRMVEHTRGITRAVILGGGLLGIEVGNALRKRGLEVTVVEVFSRLLPRQTDPEASAILQRTFEGMGLRFSLGARAIRFEGGEAVTGLLLDDGQMLEAEMVILSAGVRPRVSLLKGTGAQIGVGVIVNDRMETGVEGVYAAGDIAEHRSVLYGIWPAAEQQGSTAGTVMAGGDAIYPGTVPSNYLKVAGVDLLSAGSIDAEGKLESVIRKDAEQGVYRKLVFRDGALAGCILCGDLRGKREILAALQRGLGKDDLQQIMKDGGFLT